MNKSLTVLVLVLACLLSGACNSKPSSDAVETKPGEQKSELAADQKQAAEKRALTSEQKTNAAVSQPPHTIAIPSGTSLPVRLSQSLNTERNNSGDSFEAALDRDVRVGENPAIPARAIVTGRIYHLRRSGKVSGRAEMGLILTSVTVGGKSYPIQTTKTFHRAPATKKSDAKWIGGGAAGGALIGAIAGGKKGAGIGALVGGGAGTGKVLATRGKPVAFAAESRLVFKLTEPVEVSVAGK